ncbi:MAG: hypothetical protein FWH18_00675 [Marinilabiliaceae bacterium]|nr:hypothetical protein [Marinilabiliaceae bacterium]
MFENAYDLDVALDVVSTLWALKCREYKNETDPQKKQKLLQEVDMMQFEKGALYRNGEVQKSVMDKAFRLYAPILKAHYAAV